MNPTGAEIIIKTLAELGTDTVFGYPGGWIIEVYDALFRAHGIRHVLTAHEQGAAHAADGYARRSGRVGVVFATSGPGGTNLVTGIAAAYMDSVPLVALTCGVPPEIFGKDNFQEVDIIGVTMPITKHSFLVRKAEDIAPTLRKAFEIAASGRPGPVAVDIHADLCRRVKYSPEAPQTIPSPPDPAAAELAAAAAAINAAGRPVAVAGGGVGISGAEKELAELAERIGSPVCLTSRGLGSFDSDSPLYMGLLGMHGTAQAAEACSQADLIIAIGARFSDRTIGKSTEFAPNAKIVHIDIDAAEIGKIKHADYPIEGDAKTVLKALIPMLQKRSAPTFEKPPFEQSDCLPARVLSALDAAVTEPVLVTDVGQHQIWTWLFSRHTSPRRLITSCGLGAMGFGMGAALGAQLASPDSETLLVTGDGSFHMDMCELATAVSERLPIVILLFDNGTLGLVRQFQKKFLHARYSCTEQRRRTDFIRLAEAMGAEAEELDTGSDMTKQFKAAFSKAKKLRLPVLLHCAVDSETDAPQLFGAKEAR